MPQVPRTADDPMDTSGTQIQRVRPARSFLLRLLLAVLPAVTVCAPTQLHADISSDGAGQEPLLAKTLMALGGVEDDPAVPWNPTSVAQRAGELIRAAEAAGLVAEELATARGEAAKLVQRSTRPSAPTLRRSYKKFGGVELHGRRPLVHYFGDFLNGTEAEHLIALARPRLKRSTGMADAGTTNKIFAGRTSQTAAVEPWEDSVVSNLTSRVAAIVGLGVDHLETLSVTRYTGHEEYKAHYDAFGWRTNQDRFVTALLYLNDPPGQSGTTRFPLLKSTAYPLGLEVAPAKGGLLLFHNLEEPPLGTSRDPAAMGIERLSLHAGLPMAIGDLDNSDGEVREKWIVNCWFRGEEWEKPHDFWPAHWPPRNDSVQAEPKDEPTLKRASTPIDNLFARIHDEE